MRKQYIKPEISITEFDTSYLLCTSTSFEINSGTQGDFKEDFSQKRRRTWGDLWG